MAPDRPIVFFDGYCNLCNGAVAFIIERDRHEQFLFASLDSAAARQQLTAYTSVQPLPDSVLLLDADGLHDRSEAARRIARALTAPWCWLPFAAAMVPRFVRDAIYDWVARHRLQWFGRLDTCSVPTPDQRARFLD